MQLQSVKDDLQADSSSEEDETKEEADDTSARAIPLVGELDDLCTFAYAYDTNWDANILRAARFMRDGDNWQVIAPERGSEELFVTDVPEEKIGSQPTCYLSQARREQPVQHATRCWCGYLTESDLGSYTETMTRNAYEQEVVQVTIADQKAELPHALFDDLDHLRVEDTEVMCVSEDAYMSIVQRQALKDYHCSHWRELRNDADSYYRAVGFALFERVFGGGDHWQSQGNVGERERTNLIKRFEQVKHGDGSEK